MRFATDVADVGPAAIVFTLWPNGLATEFVGEAQEDPNAIARVKEGRVQLLYISPESLLTKHQWREMLRFNYRENLVAFVVDEAHCVKQW